LIKETSAQSTSIASLGFEFRTEYLVMKPVIFAFCVATIFGTWTADLVLAQGNPPEPKIETNGNPTSEDQLAPADAPEQCPTSALMEHFESFS